MDGTTKILPPTDFVVALSRQSTWSCCAMEVGISYSKTLGFVSIFSLSLFLSLSLCLYFVKPATFLKHSIVVRVYPGVCSTRDSMFKAQVWSKRVWASSACTRSMLKATKGVDLKKTQGIQHFPEVHSKPVGIICIWLEMYLFGWYNQNSLPRTFCFSPFVSIYLARMCHGYTYLI